MPVEGPGFYMAPIRGTLKLGLAKFTTPRRHHDDTRKSMPVLCLDSFSTVVITPLIHIIIREEKDYIALPFIRIRKTKYNLKSGRGLSFFTVIGIDYNHIAREGVFLIITII